MQHQEPLRRFTLLLAIVSLAAWAWGAAVTQQRTFATPRAAAQALLAAAEADDVPAVMNMFGPDADAILHSGDPVQDKGNRAKFVTKAKQSMKVRIDRANANRATLLIGADAFPFPIPLVRRAGRWSFDTAAGKREILARRIGANELSTIAACKAYVNAQYDYASEDRNKNGIPEYARKLISSPGQRDGLFWPGADAPPTEFTSAVKQAVAEGYRKTGSKPTPYHGYNFRILLAQGPKARGGTLNYIQHGSMIGGFGLVAWPAEYGVSGIMTFLVNQDGVVYEKDLGPSTTATAENMTAFDPDKTWRPVGETKGIASRSR
ncbi:MAG TPA: DUF2950 domain-containing protein [Bryobacteraceae bacterium]|nr:DUF2950 domain-containing protein [Bryobacteraceae bacterium]